MCQRVSSEKLPEITKITELLFKVHVYQLNNNNNKQANRKHLVCRTIRAKCQELVQIAREKSGQPQNSSDQPTSASSLLNSGPRLPCNGKGHICQGQQTPTSNCYPRTFPVVTFGHEAKEGVEPIPTANKQQTSLTPEVIRYYCTAPFWFKI